MFTNTMFGAIKVAILFAVARGNGGRVAGYDRASLSTYTWVSQGIISVVLMFTWTEVSERVHSGAIAVDLLRPIDPQLYWFAHDFGRATFAVAARLMPPIIIGGALFGIAAPHKPAAWLLFPVSLTLAVAVSFAGRWLISMVAFWLTQIRGVLTMYVLGSNLLSGLIIPLQLLPHWLHVIAYGSPFPSMLQTPVNVWTGVGGIGQAALDVGVQALWVVGMLAVGHAVFTRATRALVVLGG